jgi:hypothetical protein
MSASASKDVPAVYEICVKEPLPKSSYTWFEGLEIRLDADGSTHLIGRIEDQAALHGCLERIRDLGLVLLSLRQVPPE